MNEILDNNKTKTKQIKPKRNITKFVLLLLSYLLVALVVWKLTLKIQATPAYQQEQAKKQINTIIEKVGKLVILPSAETPQVAVIGDVEALKKEQDFFVDAEDGDNILVYVKARKAIIYRESTNKIVNIALNVGPVTDTSTSKPVQPTKETATTTQTASSSDR